MTDWGVIGIITTIIVMGLTIIGVQITMVIYLKTASHVAISKRSGGHAERIHRKEFRSAARDKRGNRARARMLEGIMKGRKRTGWCGRAASVLACRVRRFNTCKFAQSVSDGFLDSCFRRNDDSRIALRYSSYNFPASAE